MLQTTYLLRRQPLVRILGCQQVPGEEVGQETAAANLRVPYAPPLPLTGT